MCPDIIASLHSQGWKASVACVAALDHINCNFSQWKSQNRRKETSWGFHLCVSQASLQDCERKFFPPWLHEQSYWGFLSNVCFLATKHTPCSIYAILGICTPSQYSFHYLLSLEDLLRATPSCLCQELTTGQWVSL